MINRFVVNVFEFFCDPFGIQKRRDEKALEEMIERLDRQSKLVDKALERRDYDEAYRLTMRMKNL